MREIKFRAWDKWEKKMRSPADDMVLRTTGIMGFEWCSEGGGGVQDNEHLIPLQYTGIKDKNGKEIYEGDICVTSQGSIGEVAWNDDNHPGLSFKFSNTGLRLRIFPSAEIIGNIYQNPELSK